MEFTSELIIKSENPDEIKAVYNALKPETTVMISLRGKTDIKIQDEKTLRAQVRLSPRGSRHHRNRPCCVRHKLPGYGTYLWLCHCQLFIFLQQISYPYVL